MTSPTPKTPLTLSDIQAEQHLFRQRCNTLILATLNSDQWPEASYAPFIEDEVGNHYIFVSELAAHTQHLLDNKKVSWMLIADEQDTRQLFARQRFTCLGHAELIPRDQAEFSDRLEQMQEQFGDIINLLKGLADFHLLKLSPKQATYVRGFGQAYTLSGKGLNQIEHLKR
ncbi:HugZ family protein [Oceanospirillum maris]|jgi:putative heme iron utilization protein|uniref:HugZ family pyridoxamine 5'-phosphate oxidase n=1 Tax=Oceanospirillum maris TaxID=64977 RepID=UPI000400FD7C|nr:pyridoxamine 5'-phosphate oxidase family protein [Oceanospirillum maris]